MVMDENGRNGGNWHLAQQITEHVIMQKTTKHTTCNQIGFIINNKPNTMQSWLPHKYGMGGNFNTYKKNKNPPYPTIIIYNLLTNRWLEYGII